MREAIGGTWLFQIVILFILLFTGYMCLSINYTRGFDVKDKIINEIERYGGFKQSNSDDYALGNIVEYMKKVGYRATGKCGKQFDGGVGCTRDGKCDDITDYNNNNYAFCIKEVKYNNLGENLNEFYKDATVANSISPKLYGDSVTSGEFYYLSYYNVKVFYKLDLPVLSQVFNFSIDGDTKTLYKISNTKIDERKAHGIG